MATSPRLHSLHLMALGYQEEEEEEERVLSGLTEKHPPVDDARRPSSGQDVTRGKCPTQSHNSPLPNMTPPFVSTLHNACLKPHPLRLSTPSQRRSSVTSQNESLHCMKCVFWLMQILLTTFHVNSAGGSVFHLLVDLWCDDSVPHCTLIAPPLNNTSPCLFSMTTRKKQKRR